MYVPAAAPLIERIHQTPDRGVLAVTGGGSQGLSDLLSAAGASATVLEAVVPYASRSLEQLLGGRPDQHCSPDTACGLAVRCYLRARELTSDERDPGPRFGVGCTAGLKTNRPRRGPHHAHVAWQHAGETGCVSLQLAKNRRSRREEERLVADWLLNATAAACRLEERLATPLDAEEPLIIRSQAAETGWSELLESAARAVCGEQVYRRGPVPQPPAALFPGAFHPLHGGHRRMAELAAQLLGTQVAFEISVENVDKPPLDFLEMAQRRAPLQQLGPLWFTRAATFAEKARLFPGTTFVVGLDTLVRIADLRYYGDDSVRQAAIREMAELGCRLLVFGRELNGEFQTLDDVDLPTDLRGLCRGVPERHYRFDISSTQIRRQEE